MKKIFMFLLIIPLTLLLWCDNLCNKTEMEITETFWSRTCKWQWIDKIEGYAECISSSWDTYKWDVRWHNFNWKWIRINSNWDTIDWYFYEWFFIAWKVNWANGDSTKWMRAPQWSWSRFEFWKRFRKNDWQILLWDFDENWDLKYWMISFNWNISAWEFKNQLYKWFNWLINWLYNWYISSNVACFKATNWNVSEITKTITNTVYRNNWIQLSNPLGDFYKLWSQYNPYTVKLELE